MSNKKVIIFDFDGVIIDSWEHAYVGNLRNWPDLKPEEHRNFFNGNIYEELEKMPEPLYSSEDHKKWWDEIHSLTKKDLPTFDGMKEALKKLSENYILSINTSSDAVSTKNYLVGNDIDFFDSIYGTEVSKSKVEKFNKILNHYNVEAKDCFFITDTVGDIKEANALSIPTILVTWGYQNESHFNGVADKVIGIANKPEEIFNFIK